MWYALKVIFGVISGFFGRIVIRQGKSEILTHPTEEHGTLSLFFIFSWQDKTKIILRAGADDLSFAHPGVVAGRASARVHFSFSLRRSCVALYQPCFGSTVA